MKKTKLMLGDNIESLKKLPDNSVDSVVTDPPYGLSFMNKKWDYDVPSIEFWKEVYRVLKPGGHVLSFGGTRTYHRMVVNIEDAGFEIRDQIQWIYGSGFPKSHNISKAISKINGEDVKIGKAFVVSGNLDNNIQANLLNGKEKDGDWKHIPTTEEAIKYEGWGTALKPANEPICVARKPLSEKSVAENVLRWGTGGINIDGCRVGTTDTYNYKNGPQGNSFSVGKEPDGKRTEPVEMNSEGRFPANIILECICDEVIKGEKGEIVETKSRSYRGDASIYIQKPNETEYTTKNYTGKGDTHTDPNCPCRLLDEQSGFLKGDNPNRKPRKGGHREQYVGTDNNEIKNIVIQPKAFDSGGASRFFYQAKVSKAERNMGLDGFDSVVGDVNNISGKRLKCRVCDKWYIASDNCKCETPDWIEPSTKNSHPTVKPINLMAYLCRLITPEGGIVLDPFMGSGSTGVAAQLEGFRFVGMEMDKDYFKIAESRIDSYEKYNKFKK